VRRIVIRNASASYIAAVCVLCLFGSRTALAQLDGGASPTVAVLLFNYSKASPVVLTRAKQRTDAIFRESGIRFDWEDYPPLPGSVRSQRCQDESAPGEIRVRILPGHLNDHVQDSMYGFAIQPIWANVYYEPALRLAGIATDSDSNVSVLLGCLIAHEIGHLLLGQDAHTVDGIMQARWETKQIQQAMMGVLGFTSAQSKVMLRNAQLRTNPLTRATEQRDLPTSPQTDDPGPPAGAFLLSRLALRCVQTRAYQPVGESPTEARRLRPRG